MHVAHVNGLDGWSADNDTACPINAASTEIFLCATEIWSKRKIMIEGEPLIRTALCE